MSRSSEHLAPGLVYSGDCGRAEDLDALVRPGDTILTEVSFGPGPVKPGALHLDGPAVGALATRTGAGAVLLTHLQMGHDPDETVASRPCRRLRRAGPPRRAGHERGGRRGRLTLPRDGSTRHAEDRSAPWTGALRSWVAIGDSDGETW